MGKVERFADEHHLEKLRQTLWSGQGFGRAAVVVGAGFSRNAERLNPATPPMPDFRTLASLMWAELNSARPESAPSGLDPLDVASEYEGVFFRQQLNQFLERNVRDDAYVPSRIHRLLMSLPWADVFTTNWDTLLERASGDVTDRQYASIASAASLVGSRRPRIVKLHGSFPNHLPLIVTKEDFRTYPRTHAPFLNTVQQAVMECAVCLVGFGGNDPNFLAWSGWVHDHLGSTAPPIYLAGVLDLTGRRRSALEHRRVIPIDLGEAFPVADWPDALSRHRTANEWFLLNLAEGPLNPMGWPQARRLRASGAWKLEGALPPLAVPAGDVEAGDGGPIAVVLQLLDRYPGWLTCPPSAQVSFQHQLQSAGLGKALADADTATAQLLWSAVMRSIEILRTMLAAPALERLESFLEESEDGSDGWFDLACRHIAQLRYLERWVDHEKWLTRLMGSGVRSTVQHAQLRREQALSALARLDYSATRSALEGWPVLPEALWLELARACIHVELRMLDDARRIVERTLHTIRTRTVLVEGKLGPLALEGSAMVFFSMLSRLDAQFESKHGPWGRYRELARWDCDPREYLMSAQRELETASAAPVKVKKEYDSGRVYVWSSFEDSEQACREKASSALRLFEALAVPFRCGSSAFYQDVAIRAASMLASSSPASAFSVFVRADSLDGFNDAFNSLFVARLGQDAVKTLRDMGKRVVAQHWDAANVRGEEPRLALGFELLSRLVGRLPPDEVAEDIRDAVSVASHPQLMNTIHLAAAVRSCIVRGFSAVAAPLQQLLVLDLLKLPTPKLESIAVGTQSWKDSVLLVDVPRTVPAEIREGWRPWIEALLLNAKLHDAEERWVALCRLIKLQATGNLSGDQSSMLADALWVEDVDSLIFNVREFGFSPMVLLAMPGAAEQAVEGKLRARFIESAFPATDAERGSKRLRAEAAAESHFRALSQVLEAGAAPLTDGEALQLLERAASWLEVHLAREKHYERDASEFVVGSDLLDELVYLLGRHVLRAVAVGTGDSSRRLHEIASFLEKEPVSLLMLEYHFQRFGVCSSQESVSKLVRFLRAGNDISKPSAASGILLWLELDANPPSELLNEFCAALGRPGSRSFPRVVGGFSGFVHKWPSKVAMALEQILFALQLLLEQTDVQSSSNDALYFDPLWMPDTRVAAAGLAGAVWRRFPDAREALRGWAESSATDPIPDVRSAWLSHRHAGD